MVKNNFIGVITHVGILAMFYLMFTYGHLVAGSIEALILLALGTYFIIGRRLTTQLSKLRDLLSVTAAALVSLALFGGMFLNLRMDVAQHLAVPIFIQILTQPLSPFFYYITTPEQIAFLVVLSLVPTLVLWLGLLSKRRMN